jgi:N-acetyl-1-D-myo-inositol-2-amino-2-deoxy-alpha-D-glucopyranoside deacetylase
MTPRRIVLVHAHPDDECLGTGGTMALYAAEGAHVCLVTCTDGEEGEIAEIPELGPPDEIRPRLGEIRRAELIESCRRLGDIDLRPLGFRDSGMEGTEANGHPDAFINRPLDEAAAAIAEVLEEIRPQVLITYDATGLYGHPDHIRAHQAAMAAVETQPVAKVYYLSIPKSMLQAAKQLSSGLGLEPDAYFTEEDVERIGTDDDLITTSIDCTAYVEAKMDALAAHRTQLGTTSGYLEIPQEVRDFALGTEHYVLSSAGEVPAERETDLFEGL